MRIRIVTVLLNAAMLGALIGTAATRLEAQQGQPGVDCAAAASGPSTPVEKGPHSGTKNMGSTGWSGGGLGGSHNDTAEHGAAPSSKTAQPPVARGLDPTSREQNRPAC